MPALPEGSAGSGCFADPGFAAALREMQALGLRVAATPHPDSVPFDVLAGRMHLRWYLMPRGPRAARAASLALIRPLRWRARLGRRALAVAARLGLPYPGRQGVAHLSGNNRLSTLYGRGPVHAAFMTGTTGPHRKLAIQFMDGRGHILGYAKVACAPATQALLANEATVLGELRAVGLRSAVVPRVLLHAQRDGAAMLAMAAVSTADDTGRTRLGAAHRAFLDELAARTAAWHVPDGAALLHGLRAKTLCLTASLPVAWRRRLERAWRELALAPELIAPRGIAHGDFTPANTCEHRQRLCVFDWEYAGPDYPADYDLIRFLSAIALLRHRRAADWHRAVEAALVRDHGRSARSARARLMAYLYVQVLLLAGRQPAGGEPIRTWEGEPAMALMFDALHTSGPAAP